MTVDFFYKIVQDILFKNQQGYLAPAVFNRYANQAQDSFLNYLLGEFQQYQNGRPVARVEFGQNQTVRQRLTPVIYGYTLNIDAAGFSPYPGDFQQVDTMWSTYNYQRIKYIQQDRLYSYYNSSIDPIASNPVYLIEDLGFRFFPNTTNNGTTLGRAKLSYVRTPATIVWGYTIDGQGRPVYNPATSVDPEWYDTDMMEIIARVLRMAGVNLQAAEVSQFANQIEQAGQ